MGLGMGVGSDWLEPNLWAEPPPGPSGWDIAGLLAITPKPVTPNVVASARREKVAPLIILRILLCFMVSPCSSSDPILVT